MEVQKEIFQSGEGDQWYLRNKEAYEGSQNKESIITQTLESIEILPQKILEIGCSNGIRLNELHQKYGAQCYGIEPSVSAVSEGSKKFPHLNLQVGTADHLPFERSSFDVLIFGFCLCYCDRKDLFKIAQEADRCISDNGYLVLMDFSPPFAYKNTYAHKDGVYVYKMDYSRMFSWNPNYTQIYQVVFSHAGFSQRDLPDERVSVTVLHKSQENAYLLEPFQRNNRQA